ncbi:MAG TPA: transposase [Burkholderiales bacterium]|nr:transposase [Burkholderiales bacterium]
MPRANRSFVPGQIWHITHRCHERAFLLKFKRDRRTYLDWIYEARRRYGLCLLNYVVTCNHVHLLVKDTAEDAIARSMQLIAGRTAQAFNLRKRRQGAFWEDRYHATAVETGEHLRCCVIYIDLNMVRAGAVSHPADWPHGGYREIQNPPARYRMIDLAALSASCGFERLQDFQRAHREWVASAVERGVLTRDTCWTDAVAVGSAAFVERVKHDLGSRGKWREVVTGASYCMLRQETGAYSLDFG